MNAGQRFSGAAWAGTNSKLSGIRQAVALGVSLLPVALGGFLFLSWATSLLVPALKYSPPSAPPWVFGAVLYLCIFGTLGWILRQTKAHHEKRVVLSLIGLSMAIKLALVLGFSRLPLFSDQELFHYFVREMADHRLNGATLSGLSNIYDYPVWAGRVLPVHYAVRCLAVGADILWIRLINVVLSTAILLAIYGFSCRLLPVGRRKWAVFLMVALPFQSFVVTDYSHHLFSSFYFLLGMWLAWEMVFSSPRPLQRLALSGLGGLCLLLMMWQRGVHLIALGVWGAMLIWALFSGMDWRRWGWILLGLGVIPLVLSLPPAGRFDAWLNRHDTHRFNSILPAFVARGWCPESAGEYSGRYEQLDRVTPWPEKKSAMYRLVLSQIRYNAKTVCVRFPVIKTAKLFMVGYASNFEEGLSAVQSRALPWVRGMRLAAAPIFLGLAIWGCLGLALRPRDQSRWLPVLLAPILTWGAYVFLGETSPRYSIFCQPFLALLGALALAGCEKEGPAVSVFFPGAWKGLALRGVIVAGGLAIALGAGVAAVRLLPAYRLYADVEQGWTSVSSGGGAIAAGAYRPFEAVLSLTPDGASVQDIWRLPPRPDSAQTVSFYLLNAEGAARTARLSIGTPVGTLTQISLEELKEPRYLEVALPPRAESLIFTMEPVPGAKPASGNLQIGYVSFTERIPAK